jgi:hypothetical protein
MVAVLEGRNVPVLHADDRVDVEQHQDDGDHLEHQRDALHYPLDHHFQLNKRIGTHQQEIYHFKRAQGA